MAMTNFASKLWNWLINRSPRNATQSDPTVQMDQQTTELVPACNNRPFETYIETDSIQGFVTKVGWQESGVRTPDGELFRTRENFALPLGCGHIARQQQAVDQQDQHIRGIAGICYYCQQELLKALSRGEITPFDAERLSLVCSDCGKITVSGQLCCPKHYARLAGPAGAEVYLGPEDIKKQEQNRLTSKMLGPILGLFLEEGSTAEQPKSQEQDNAQNAQ
jgi:hypothetical protein